MATITSLGVGSGLDLNTMVTQLVALERKPLQAMQKAASTLNTQVSSFGQMQSLLGTLQDAANALAGNSLWAGTKASSGDESVVTATGGSGAAEGSYAVKVDKLAQNQTLVSAASYSSATALVGSGTLTITRGTWDGGLTALGSPGTPVNITVEATDTLETLRNKINGAGAGVTASLVTDSSGVRLALRSDLSGAANGFSVTASDSDGNDTDAAGLSAVAFDPPSGTSGMLYRQAGIDAEATINGIAVKSASNELTGVVTGLTLTLKKETAGASTNVTVSNDRDAVTTAVKTFADAYSALAKYIADQTKYDANSKVGGPLQGDSAATGLQSQLRAVLATMSGASAAFPRLSDVGLQVQRDGTLKVDSTKLASAANNLTELKKAFANTDGANASNEGFARRYAKLATQALGVDGVLTTRTDGLRKALSRNSVEQDKLNARVDLFQQRLVAQYTAMDSSIAKLNSLSSYVTQTLNSLNKSSSGG